MKRGVRFLQKSCLGWMLLSLLLSGCGAPKLPDDPQNAGDGQERAVLELKTEHVKEIYISRNPIREDPVQRWAHITDPEMCEEVIETINGWLLAEAEETGDFGSPGGLQILYDGAGAENGMFGLREYGLEKGNLSWKSTDFSMEYFWSFFDRPGVEVVERGQE